MEPLKGIALESEAGEVAALHQSGGPETRLLDRGDIFTRAGARISLNTGNKYYKYCNDSVRAGLIVLLGLHARGNDAVS